MNRALTVGSLFAGIGGFDLGLERAGMRVIWQSEIDPYASAVLRKHWPTVPNLGDIRGITAQTLADAKCSEWRPQPSEADEQHRHDGGRQEAPSWVGERGTQIPDILCGGFPCQDISNAGKLAGIDGERSGLWSEFARLIGELRPRYAIMENVAALLGRGLERVLGDLAALGYDAEWHCIPASAVGAPHRRDRIWIVAYSTQLRGDGGEYNAASISNAGECRQLGEYGSSQNVAHTGQQNVEGLRLAQRIREERDTFSGAGWWSAEPDVDRVAHGIPARVDRLRFLGNAIVPQVAEIIGRSIMQAEGLI